MNLWTLKKQNKVLKNEEKEDLKKKQINTSTK